MKYRVHTYHTIRVSFEVEAESAQEAKEFVEDSAFDLDPYYVDTYLDSCDMLDEFIVDPILPNGEVDYDNVVNFNF